MEPRDVFSSTRSLRGSQVIETNQHLLPCLVPVVGKSKIRKSKSRTTIKMKCRSTRSMILLRRMKNRKVFRERKKEEMIRRERIVTHQRKRRLNSRRNQRVASSIPQCWYEGKRKIRNSPKELG